MKAYGRDFQVKDDASWQAITTGEAVTADLQGAYVDQFLKPLGYAYASSTTHVPGTHA